MSDVSWAQVELQMPLKNALSGGVSTNRADPAARRSTTTAATSNKHFNEPGLTHQLVLPLKDQIW